MIKRPHVFSQIKKALKRSRVTALVGPRQCGKTTLARMFLSPRSPNYFDLEDPASLSVLAQNPMNILDRLKGLIVIDEIQRLPDIFPLLRVLADRKPLPARFLILGSAAPHLLRQSSESLAGRIETIDISGLSANEIGWKKFEHHWLRGGFPLSFLAPTEEDNADCTPRLKTRPPLHSLSGASHLSLELKNNDHSLKTSLSIRPVGIIEEVNSIIFMTHFTTTAFLVLIPFPKSIVRI